MRPLSSSTYTFLIDGGISGAYVTPLLRLAGPRVASSASLVADANPAGDLELAWYVAVGPWNVGPHRSALRVAFDTHANRKCVHHQQAATVFA